MQAQAIKMKQGWFIPELSGFEDIKSEIINIEVELSTLEYKKLDYKELRGIDIMERYNEKSQREVLGNSNVSVSKMAFSEKFKITNTLFSTAIRAL